MEDKVRRASTTQSSCDVAIPRRHKYDVLSYLKAHPNIQIIEMSTNISRKEKKGLISVNTEAIRAPRSL